MAHHPAVARIPTQIPRRRVLSADEIGIDDLAAAAPSIDPAGVAIIASWSTDARVSRSLDTLVRSIVDDGFQTFLVRASDDTAPLEWDAPRDVTVVRRPNSGYDFGSWAAAIRAVPRIVESQRVLLANDSLVGPFAPLDAILSSFREGGADAWGAVMSAQVFPHLQTYMYGFRDGLLREPVLREFWGSVTEQASRDDYIARYELGLNRALFSEGFSIDAAFGIDSIGYRHVNPTLDEWRALLHRGFPFLKRALLTDPDDRARAHAAADEAAALYGVDIAEWM